MIQQSYVSLLMWSAEECGELYSRGYLAELETHSPFRFACVAQRRKQLGKLKGPLARVFEAFLEDEEECGGLSLAAGTLIGSPLLIGCNYPG